MERRSLAAEDVQDFRRVRNGHEADENWAKQFQKE